MSDLTTMLLKQLSPQLIDIMSKQLGADQNKVSSAITSLLPMMMAGMARNTRQSGGADALLKALTQDHSGGLLDQVTGLLMQQALGGGSSRNGCSPLGMIMSMLSSGGGRPAQKAPQDLQRDLDELRSQNPRSFDGDGILKHVLGDKRHKIERGVSKNSGLSEDQVGKLSSELAPLLMGSLGKVQQERNLDANSLSELLNGTVQDIEKQATPSNPNGLIGMLDADGDGDIMDDLQKLSGMGNALFGKR